MLLTSSIDFELIENFKQLSQIKGGTRGIIIEDELLGGRVSIVIEDEIIG